MFDRLRPSARTSHAGFSLVEVIVVSALIVLVFGGLIGMVRSMVLLLGEAKSQSTALSLATNRMEYIRSLSYNKVGTQNGVPSGAIPQNRTVTANKVQFNERVLIVYVDDPADGTSTNDTNGIITDYKQVKVEYTWTLHGKDHKVSLVSDIMPAGIESTAGGGTIRVNVFDANAAPVAGAAVQFVNTTGTSTIDTTRYTTADGVAYLSGAPAGSGYEIHVSKPGYSTDGTYTPDSTVVNPDTPPVAVLESQVSTMNFQIDQVASLKLTTHEAPTYGTFTDTFANTTKLSARASTTVSGGSLRLSIGASDGVAYSATITPALLDHWYSLKIADTVPTSTTAVTSVYAVSSGAPVLVPDSDLAGNSTGFHSGTVSLEALDPATYPALMLGTHLSTTDTNTSPSLQSWQVQYVSSHPVASSVELRVHGQKTYGTDSNSNPVWRYDVSTSTDTAGQRTLSNLAWDDYLVSVTDPSYSLREACPSVPYSVAPASADTVNLDLVTKQTYGVRVVVERNDGTYIPDASVTLSNTGYNVTHTTSLCGQTYFSSGADGVSKDSNYTVTASSTGYIADTVTGVSITNDNQLVVMTLTQ